ncbi:MAG: hypothetical protein ACK5LN_02100 [Propioniciclava sp.]
MTHHRLHQLRSVANWLNLTTPVGIALALAGRARLRAGPERLVLADHYRLPFPVAGAFTVGNVILSAESVQDLDDQHPGTLAHEGRHAWQYAVGGVWFFPAYTVAAAWSMLRTGSPALANPFERHAGLHSGGYLGQPQH